MRINGEWLVGDDGVARPVLPIEVLLPDGSWREAVFLVDSGADSTVFNAALAAAFPVPSDGTGPRLAGVGGTTTSGVVHTRIRLTEEQGGKVTIEGAFLTLHEPGALDSSVPGRDVTNLFACIIDRPGDVVCLLGQRHRYRIETVDA